MKHELRRSHREIARSLGIANSTVSDCARRASAAGLSWPLPEELDDAALEAALFVGVLGASNHTFVDVTRSRSLPDRAMSHVRMVEHRGGVPELVIPDNEKAAVHRAGRYEPELNPTYRELARHDGTTVLPRAGTEGGGGRRTAVTRGGGLAITHRGDGPAAALPPAGAAPPPVRACARDRAASGRRPAPVRAPGSAGSASRIVAPTRAQACCRECQVNSGSHNGNGS